MTLSNEKITLRAVEKDDLDMLYILENEMYAGGSSFLNGPVSRHLLWQYIQSYSADIYVQRQLRLIVCDVNSGESVGIVDLTDYEPHDGRAFVGIAVLNKFRRCGYAQAALTLMCDYASKELGLHQLAAQVAVDNVSSIKLFHSCGFKTCGSLRSWIRRGKHYADALLFQRLFP